METDWRALIRRTGAAATERTSFLDRAALATPSAARMESLLAVMKVPQVPERGAITTQRNARGGAAAVAGGKRLGHYEVVCLWAPAAW